MIKKIYILLAIILTLSTNACAYRLKLENAASKITDGSFTDDLAFAQASSDTAISSLKPQNILIYMLDCVKNILSGTHSRLDVMLAVIFLAALTEVFGKNLGSSYGFVNYASLLSLMLVCFNTITPLLVSVTDFLVKHTAFMTSMTASTGTLLAASGSAGGAAASSASAAFITGFTQLCSVNIILPAVKIIIVLSSVDAISKSMDLSGITGFLKSFCTYGIGLLFAVFLGVHALTLNIASSADSLAFRSLRFTAARLIPVAGGMISESIKTVLSAMSLIKNAAGGIGIAYIIYTTIPAVFSILAVKATILTALGVSKIFGTRRHTVFLDGLNGACSMIFAICIFASFGGIIILAVFMKTALNL